MATENAKTMDQGFKVVDLFAGCGGMSMGFENAGFSITAAFENWKPAIETYKANFAHPIYDFDLNDSSSAEVIAAHGPDVIIGGPPCQDFSSAGHRDETRGRADLTLKYAEIVSQVHPRAFVMENVPRIRKSALLNLAKGIFRDAGYGLTEVVLDASYCGVPQSRKRYFLIGVLGLADGALQDDLLSNLTQKPMTMRDYFGNSLGFDHYFRVPRTYARRGVFSIDEPASTVRGVDRPVPKGYPGHVGDTAPLTGDLRTLTALERAQVQTFPKDFILPTSKTTANEMIGNAVPVNLARYVAQVLLKQLLP